MKSGARWLLVFAVVLAIGGLASWVAVGAADAAGVSVLSGALVTPGSPAQGEQIRVQEEVERSSPEATAAREASRTKFEGLAPSQAAAVASESFPSQIDEQAGGPPKLPAGGQVTGYLGGDAARVLLSEGQRAVVESSQPMAVEAGPGQWLPLDLTLSESAGGFTLARPAVSVAIPKRLQDGVSLPGSGISLTPLGSSGEATGGAEGRIDGACVFYGGVEMGSDVDVSVKPLASGFAEDAILRSERSPKQISFRLGVPEGASVAQSPNGSGPVVVSKAGQPIALVATPVAEDAAGSPVPVAMTVSGTTLTLTITESAGEFQYPIMVDPTVIDKDPETLWPHGNGNWKVLTDGTNVGWGDASNEHGFEDSFMEGELSRGQYADMVYTTEGESKIRTSRVDVTGTFAGAGSAAYVAVAGASYEAGPVEIPWGPEWHELSVAGSNGNSALYERIGTAAESTHFRSTMYGSEQTIEQTAGPTVEMDTTDEVVDGEENPLYHNRWVNSTSSEWGLKAHAHDPGVGISGETWTSPSAPKWEGEPSFGSTERYPRSVCNGPVQCAESWSPSTAVWPNDAKEALPEGEDTIDVKVEDAFGYTATATATLKVDNTPPSNLTVTGLPSSDEISDGQSFQLKASATDARSGIASIEVSVDGQQLGSPSGGCSGACTANGEWTLTGEAYGAGKHTLTVKATDLAGNVTSQSYTVTVHHATPMALGPGWVNPVTGEYSLAATDVSIATPGAGLTVSRSYRSRHLSQGSEGPLGTQWTLSLGAEQSLSKRPNGSMVLTGSNGAQTVFTASGGGFSSPKGDAGVTLSEKKVGEASEFLLSEGGTTTTFALPTGSKGSVWEPAVSQGAGGTGVSTFSYKLEGAVIEPTEELAPVPAGVSCSPTLNKGCRALKFVYGKETKATGEGPSEWGEYKGRLMEVTYTAWDPASKAMKTRSVADYAWDKQGRLRAEWNPQVEPALKTIYGYDPAGHVSAASAPGVQPWLLHYGTTPSDSAAGRVLSVVRPAASSTESLKAEMEQGTPANTAVPTLSSTKPVIGTALSVASNGSWNGAPLSYAYQWERCSYTGSECAAIPGAANERYTPVLADNGHALAVSVTALNANGAAAAVSTASSPVAIAPMSASLTFGATGSESGEFIDPGGTAVAPGGGSVWATDAVNNRVEEWSSSGSFLLAAGWGVADGKAEFETCKTGCKAGLFGTGAGEFENPEGIAINQSTGVIYIASSGSDKIQELSSAGAPIAAFGTAGSGAGQLSSPHGIAIEEGTGSVYVADTDNNRIEKFSSSGEYEASFGKKGTGAGEFTSPIGVAVASGYVYVADTENNRVQKLTTSGSYVSAWGSKGTGQGQFSYPWALAVDPISGLVYVADWGNSRIEAFSPEGAFLEEFGKYGSGSKEFKSPSGIAISPSTGAAFISDEYNNRIDVWSPNVLTEEPVQPAPNPGTTAVSTIDYNVPLSGSGLPSMTSSEVAKWGETDLPAEATAIFPPDSPQGWPAKEYKRASITYLDAQDRAVNEAGPTGGVATTEYNAYNDVTRTLSPDNRASALAAGAKSAEVSKELDSESTYNETGSEPGTELLSTLGPKHTVQLASGSQVEARAHIVYSYNEGAPSEGGPYHLVTKMTEGAQIPGKEEADIRTTAYSYSAQNNLGWKLRKPTATTVDPTGLKLTHSIFYEPKTGAVTETRMPAAGAPGEEQGYFFAAQFGEAGTKSGQFKEPQDVVVTATDYSYVLDTGNHRIEEFNPQHVFVRTFGEERLKEPHSLALDPKGDVWAANTGENNLVEFSPEGTYLSTIKEVGKPSALTFDAAGNLYELKTGESAGVTKYVYSTEYKIWTNEGGFGSHGSGETQFSEPQGIALGAENSIYISDTGNNRISEWTLHSEEKATHVRNFGKEGTGNGELKSPHGLATDSSGDVWVADTGNNRIQEFNATGSFLGAIGKAGTGEGKLKEPRGVAIDGEVDAWIADTANSNVQEWTPNGTGYGSSSPSAHDTQTIYYTAGTNPQVVACGEHPEWANLPCQTQPAAQPEGTLPKLQVTSYTYNYWLEQETTTNTSGSTTRTTTQSHDAAGRPTSTQITSTVGTALPTTTVEYSKERGTVEKQSTSEGKTITSLENTLGEPISYTDADGATTTYEHDIDGRLTKTNTGKGIETFSYNETTGLPSELVNEYGGTKLAFTATEDVEGNLVSERWPNGMTATTTLNSTGKPVSLEYKKVTHCSEKCVWFSDTVVPSIHGQWLSQTSTLSKQAYGYDNAGRLTMAQSTPTGKGCTTRLYGWDADTNRTSMTTREPNSKGECATEGGSEEKHTYDSADRLTDAGVAYDAFGNTTTLPATDASGKEASEALTSSFYVDDQLQSETQNGQTVGFNLDPAGRTRETVSTGTKVSDVISHYSGPGSGPSWTINTSGETSRNITGIDGQLAAIQYGTEAPVLQLSNLHGDLIATASVSETATELASKADTTEFGVPAVTAPAKYAWLGAIELPTELPSGVVSMGARAYIPQLGRFLQDDPIPGGSANAYTYTFGDPVNTSDPTGASTIYELIGGHAAQVGAEAQAKEEAEIAARRAAEEAAARALAEEQARQAAWDNGWAAGPQYTEGEEEWEEWGEEEGEYEYASYEERTLEREASFGPGVAIAVVDDGEGHLEDAVVIQAEEGNEGDREGYSPRCGSATQEAGLADTLSRSEHREYVHGPQCPVMPKSWYKNKRYKVRIRGKHGSWRTVFNTYCGIVGGAALTPGVDVFGAPAEIGCAGYGVYTAVETIVEFL